MKELTASIFSIAILYGGCYIASHHGAWAGFGSALGASMALGLYAAVYSAKR